MFQATIPRVARRVFAGVLLALSVTLSPSASALPPLQDIVFIDRFETQAPDFLGYPAADYELLVGSPIAPIDPVLLGGAQSFAVVPALPDGLSLSTASGRISGTPTSAAAAADHTITATNEQGSDSTVVTVRVTASFVYSGGPFILFRNQVAPPIAPTSSGGFDGFSIVPALPTGLGLDPVSGVISGTPTTVSAGTTYTVTASDLNGPADASFDLSVIDAPPSGLAYASAPFVFSVNTPIAAQTPTVTGVVDSYSIAPDLPAGLGFDTTSGTISGTPTTSTPTASYLVTATNASGSTSVSISISVSGSFTYPGSPFTFQRGVAITPIGPTGTGGFSAFSIDPALPAGLTIDANSGVISGAALVTSTQATYDISGSDAGGPTVTSIQITVVEPAPTNLSYANAPFVFQQSVAITAQTPTVDGVATGFGIAPALPAGLSFDTTSGRISGTPSEVASTADYVVTASNATGSTQTTIAITVNGVLACDGEAIGGACWFFGENHQSCDQVCAPHGGYSEITRTFAGSDGTTQNCADVLTQLAITNPTPVTVAATLNGMSALGCASDYSDTALSYRLTSATTGAASSNGNSRFVRRACACNDQPAPTSVAYAGAPFVFTQGIAITAANPTVSGFASSFGITPTLPTGLLFDTNTGQISGTPSVVDAEDAYTVTASNAGGNVQTTFSLRVDGAPPSGLSYPNPPYVFSIGSTITPQTPTVSGQVTGYTIDPALPAGLSFSAVSGTISGAPSVLSAATDYTVTASNSFGSDEVVISIQVVAASTCDGSVVGGFCWWLGANAQSCTTVCSSHGGYNGGSLTFAGSSGTDANCAAVATQVAVDQGLSNPTPVSSAASIGGVGGLGCASDYSGTATTYRITSATTEAASQSFTRRMCACNAQPGPVSISYAGAPFSFAKDNAITPRSPTANGYVRTYGISPALPAGLTLDTATGVISGTPTAASASAPYTVTATNAGGFVQTSFNLAVFVQAPSNLQYPLSTYVFSQNQTITPQVPSYDGSDATSFTINVGLPTGLSFNTGTGAISGTPTTIAAASNRIITAINSAGSDDVTISIQVSAPVSCAGQSIGGSCWYFGENNQSCDTVCSTHGGYDAATQTFVGSGGTSANCKTVLTALGAFNASTQTPIEVATLGGISGMGCGSDYTNEATSYRLTSTTTSGASSASNSSLFYRRACGCAN